MGGKQRARRRAVPPLLRRKQLPASRATSIAHRMVTDLTRPGLLAWFQPDGSGAESTAFPHPLTPPGGSLKRNIRGHVTPSTPCMACIVYLKRPASQVPKCAAQFQKSQTATETLFFQDFGHCIFRVSRLLQKIDNKGVMFFLCTSHALGLHFLAVKLYNASNPNH